MNLYKNFECINSIYLSDKSKKMEKYNILVLKINKDFNKQDIKKSIFNIFKIKIKKVNIVKVKNKKLILKKNIKYIKIYKKAYVFLNKNDYKYINKLENRINDINKI